MAAPGTWGWWQERWEDDHPRWLWGEGTAPQEQLDSLCSLHTHTWPRPQGRMGSHIPSGASTPQCLFITPRGAATHFSRCFPLMAPRGSFQKSSRQNVHLPKGASALRQGKEDLVPKTFSHYSRKAGECYTDDSKKSAVKGENNWLTLTSF